MNLFSPYQSWIKPNTNSKREKGNFINNNHSTRHQTTLIQDWISNEQVGSKKKAKLYLIYKILCS